MGSGIAGIAGALAARLKGKGGDRIKTSSESIPMSLIGDEIRLRLQGVMGKVSVIGEILKSN